MGKLISPAFTTWPWVKWSEERELDIALRDGDKVWTWSEVSTQTNRYANGLLQQGVKRDDVIVGIAKNCIELIWLQLASVRIGARFAAINPKTPSKQLHQLVTSIAANHIWFGEGQETISGTWHHLQLINAEYGAVAATWQPTRLATLTFTSGSTGNPKAVAHSASNHLHSAAGLLSWLHFDVSDSWLVSLPLFHVSGLAIVWRWLLSGGMLVMPTEQGLLNDLAGVTHASLVPTQLQRILDSGETSQLALKRVLLGGSVIPTELTIAAQKQGIECWLGYGMTEMGSTVTAKRADGEPGVGNVLPYRELRIEEGEVWVKGESLTLGYYRSSGIIDVANEDGWFETKDLGSVINAELHIHGRADNMFISGGENIHPEKIEQVLLTHHEIDNVIVVDVPDEEYGQRPVAVLVSNTGKIPAKLIEFIQDKLTKFEQPIRYEIMPEHLLISGIKISRKLVKEWVDSLPITA
ncbi:o-succinylbenzoate--CoA ligase [Aliivibrio fischeri]|uniref:o-succinylbenzoate--CoA ligase n=1 Tax=Aliivibrio fischeri TaxID=668 RepID=UPI0007C44625|nr:o-succinylbenzoate--CoA ligase [Aliivibrio fischeri]MBP3142319.1 o-succinylbenzoate--CoA ligase [Aliivibrio fischeri]MBP3157055.1 o-succinylbenzoate--CoA ligase [Aliivibrio fischeri]